MQIKQTPQAKKFWSNIDPKNKLILLNNVWCVECNKVTSIGNTDMKIVRGDLIIKGVCTRCGGEVCRVVEEK